MISSNFRNSTENNPSVIMLLVIIFLQRKQSKHFMNTSDVLFVCHLVVQQVLGH